MRATIDLPDHLRAALIEVAGRKGYRGYSKVIVEAIEFYLAEKEARDSGLSKLLEMKGGWSPQEGHDVRRRLSEADERWE